MFLPLHDSAPLRVIRFQHVTGLIILINVLVFLYTRYGVADGVEKGIVLSFGVIPAVLTDKAELAVQLQVIPEFATLVTYMFLHGGWMHLIGNMAFLWVFADNVEDGFGHIGFLLFYLVCGIAAVGVHIMLAPDSKMPLIGASGAVAGVMAAYLLLFPKSRVWVLLLMRLPIRISAVWALAGWFVFQIISALASGVGVQARVAWWAHIGGFIAGFLIVLALRGRLLRRLDGGRPLPLGPDES